MIVNCNCCNKEINRKPSVIKKNNNSFCSKICKDSFYTKQVEVFCTHCNKISLKKPFDLNASESGNLFCSRSCFVSWNNTKRIGEKHPRYRNDSTNYRRNALDNNEKECNRCGYNEYLEILEVHHKDYDRNNNHIDNLEVLCPNCHKIEHFIKK